MVHLLGARFEFWLGHKLPQLTFIVVFLAPSDLMLDSTLKELTEHRLYNNILTSH